MWTARATESEDRQLRAIMRGTGEGRTRVLTSLVLLFGPAYVAHRREQRRAGK